MPDISQILLLFMSKYDIKLAINRQECGHKHLKDIKY